MLSCCDSNTLNAIYSPTHSICFCFSRYCGDAALVDYSNEEDMLKLFKQGVKPSKDSLFQIAHDVAQSVADAHHFNKHGRATVAHLDIKPNQVCPMMEKRLFASNIAASHSLFALVAHQWIWLNDRFVLNDFNLARMLTWDPVNKTNCKVASGYSEGRVSSKRQNCFVVARLRRLLVIRLSSRHSHF